MSWNEPGSYSFLRLMDADLGEKYSQLALQLGNAPYSKDGTVPERNDDNCAGANWRPV
jgi:hypothetical protein